MFSLSPIPVYGGFFGPQEQEQTQEESLEENKTTYSHNKKYVPKKTYTLHLTAIFRTPYRWVIWINGYRLDSQGSRQFFQWRVIQVLSNSVRLCSKNGDNIELIVNEPLLFQESSREGDQEQTYNNRASPSHPKKHEGNFSHYSEDMSENINHNAYPQNDNEQINQNDYLQHNNAYINHGEYVYTHNNEKRNPEEYLGQNNEPINHRGYSQPNNEQITPSEYLQYKNQGDSPKGALGNNEDNQYLDIHQSNDDVYTIENHPPKSPGDLSMDTKGKNNASPKGNSPPEDVAIKNSPALSPKVKRKKPPIISGESHNLNAQQCKELEQLY